jgi:hypothetical protein
LLVLEGPDLAGQLLRLALWHLPVVTHKVQLCVRCCVCAYIYHLLQLTLCMIPADF